MQRLRILCACGLLLLVAGASADSLDEVVKSVKEVCSRPAESSKYWDVKTVGEGEVSVTLKRLPKATIGGQLEFSKGEWEGVERVLREHVASDSADYRQCVRDLTPMFLEKVETTSSVSPPQDLSGRWDEAEGYYWIVRPTAQKGQYRIEKYTNSGSQIGAGTGTLSENLFAFQLDQKNHYVGDTLMLVSQHLEGQLAVAGDQLVGTTDDLSSAEWETFLATVEDPTRDDPSSSSYVARLTLVRH